MDRIDFKALFGECMLCGDAWRNGVFPKVLDVHEIARGAARKLAVVTPATWLVLCRVHHDEVACWPVTRQLALKKLRDAERFNLEIVNRLRHRSEWAITDNDVHEEIDLVLQRLNDFGLRIDSELI